MCQNFALVSEMTSVFFMATSSAKKWIRKDHKKLNWRGTGDRIAAESPADAEILTQIQKFLHHFIAQELPKIGHLKIFVYDDKENHETKVKVK